MILYLDAFCYLHFALFFRHSLWPIRTDPRRHTSWEPLFSCTLRWRLLSPLNASIVPLPFIIVHFHSAVALIVLICCIRNVLQNEKIKSVLWQSCSINNVMRSCLAPCQTWLSAQIWTRNGESLLVYACMHESMWFLGSELRLCCQKDKWLLEDYKRIHL